MSTIMTNNIQQLCYSGNNANYISSDNLSFKGYAVKTLEHEQILENEADNMSTAITYTFLDPCVRLDSGVFNSDENYYFKFCVRKTQQLRKGLKIMLAKQGSSTTHTIKRFSIPKSELVSSAEDVLTIETIFSPPSNDFNEIRIEMDRDSDDLFIQTELEDLNEIILKNINREEGNFFGVFNAQGTLFINNLDKTLTLDKNNNMAVADSSVFAFKNNNKTYYFVMGRAEDESSTAKLICYSSFTKDPLTNEYTLSDYLDEISLADIFPSPEEVAAFVIEDSQIDDADSLKTHWITTEASDASMFTGDWLPIYYYNESKIQDISTDIAKTKIARNIELYKIKNLTSGTSQDAAENYEIYKVGLQGKPGMMFTLDGAELRIGPTGIYQIEYSDLKIKEIGIIPIDTRNSGSQNFFILDYKYKEITGEESS